MKKILSALLLATAVCPALPASAQYYQLANQLPQLIQPALSGSLNYKGFVETSFIKGIGNYNANFLGVSTSQGFKYSDWFFMGVGAGVDMIFAHSDAGVHSGCYPNHEAGKNTTETGVVIPLFTDFRFNIGSMSKTSLFFGIKLGCSFLVSNDYILVGDGMLTGNECLYFRPSAGVRIPVNKDKPKRALNIAVNYQLMTSNYLYWDGGDDNATLNGLGISLSYEW